MSIRFREIFKSPIVMNILKNQSSKLAMMIRVGLVKRVIR